MSLIDRFVSGQFIDVIRLDAPSDLFLAEKWSRSLDEIKRGATLIVDPGFAAVFVHNGTIEAIETESGRWSLETENLPFVSSLQSFMQGGETRDKAQVYFVRTHPISDQKWGTTDAVTYLDPTYDFPVELRAFGNFTFRITNVETFFGTYIASKPHVITDAVRQMIAGRIIGAVASFLAEIRPSYDTCDAIAHRLGGEILTRIADECAASGITVTDFRIEGTSFTDATKTQIERITTKKAQVLGARATEGVGAAAIANYQAFEMADTMQCNDTSSMLRDSVMMGMAMWIAQAPLPITPPITESPETRLIRLRSLLDKELITQEEYEAKKTEILKEL